MPEESNDVSYFRSSSTHHHLVSPCIFGFALWWWFQSQTYCSWPTGWWHLVLQIPHFLSGKWMTFLPQPIYKRSKINAHCLNSIAFSPMAYTKTIIVPPKQDFLTVLHLGHASTLELWGKLDMHIHSKFRRVWSKDRESSQ